jgi:anti-anti-sigma factor
MEPCNMSPDRFAAERWLDEGGNFSSEAVARAQNGMQIKTASPRTPQVTEVKHGFTRRCGKRHPVDKSPCLHAYGHEGRHAWEPTHVPSNGANGGSAVSQAASFSSDRIADCTEVLTLNGECDLSTALLAERRIVSALDAGTTEIIFDLRGVTSIGRSMLQVLVRALIRMGRNGRVVLVRPNVHVWARFEESGLDRGFSTFSDLRGALAEVSRPHPRKQLGATR